MHADDNYSTDQHYIPSLVKLNEPYMRLGGDIAKGTEAGWRQEPQMHMNIQLALLHRSRNRLINI